MPQLLEEFVDTIVDSPTANRPAMSVMTSVSWLSSKAA
jgi:hypothetical protein